MNALSNLQEKLSQGKRYRESWTASVVKRMLPFQIRVLRRQREWSQADLAKGSELTQGAISRAEDPNYGNLSINTLVRIAAGFDCAFVGRFVPFSELGRWYTAIAHDKALEVPSFPQDRGFETLPGLVSGNLANCTYWQSARLDAFASMQATETSFTHQLWQIPKKEPRVAVASTPHRPESLMTTTDVQMAICGIAEGR